MGLLQRIEKLEAHVSTIKTNPPVAETAESRAAHARLLKILDDPDAWHAQCEREHRRWDALPAKERHLSLLKHRKALNVDLDTHRVQDDPRAPRAPLLRCQLRLLEYELQQVEGEMDSQRRARPQTGE